MSAFSPLNLVEDAPASKKDLEEEHTRELEIENAYKTYSEALSLQSENDWVGAYAKYKELSNSTVVVNHFYDELAFVKGFQNGSSNLQPDELSFVPQNVKKIRFLYFRNRGFLHFNILRSGRDTLDQILAAESEAEPLTLFELQRDLFYTMLDGFVNCLLYEEADESLLRILFDIYMYLDVRRLARFTLEYCMSPSHESEEIMGLPALTEWAEPLWTAFEQSGFTQLPECGHLEEKLSFLEPLRADFVKQVLDKSQLHSLTVPLKANSSWVDVVQGINAALREKLEKERTQEYQRTLNKWYDPYSVTEATLDDVQFTYVEENAQEPAAETVAPETKDAIEEEQKVANETAEEVPESLAPAAEAEPAEPPAAGDKASMRISKRLNPGDSAPLVTDDIQLVRRYFVETEHFLGQFNTSLKSIYGVEEPVVQDIICYIINTEPAPQEPQYIYDFLRILNEWKTQRYDPILFHEKSADSQQKSQSDKKRLIEVLTTFGNHFCDSKEKLGNLCDAQNASFVRGFISHRFADHFHINEVKLGIVSQLMWSITNTTWEEQLFGAISEWVMQLEPSFLQKCQQGFREKGYIEDLSLGIGIYEALVNSYIVAKDKLEQLLEAGAHTSFVKSVKLNYNAATIELLRIKDRIEKWSSLFNQMFLGFLECGTLFIDIQYIIRYYWASNYYVAAKSFSWQEKKYVVIHLHKLADILSKFVVAGDYSIPYPNHTEIGSFSLEALQRRLSTASILAIFSKILDQSDSETSSTNETISLLESILFDEDPQPDQEDSHSTLSEVPGGGSLVNSVMHGLAVLDRGSLSSVKEFFHACPINLKLSLWNILFSYYQKDSFFNFQKGLEHYLQFILEFFNSTAYKEHETDKDELLLHLLASFHDNLKTFLEYLSENKWQLPSRDIGIRHLSNLSKVYELCYLFSLHEEAALYTSRKVSVSTKSESSFEYFKDFFIDCTTVISTYCFNFMSENSVANKDTSTSNLLVLVHHQLGLRHLCDCSKGLFLKFAEDALVTLSTIPETELTQIMACRYHYKVKLHGHFPADHYTTKSAELNKRTAEELAAFILPICFQSNPLTQTPRNDLKQVVDDLFEIIGDPDVDNDKILSENIVKVERFIDSTLVGSRFVKEAFHGLVTLELSTPLHSNRVAEEGLYFLEAVLMFNSYKMRKKLALSRTVELERIITLLIYDLTYKSDRVESWTLLAQAYSFMVEDDLIWTSDKINAVEKKIPTAILQRKSLVSYLMAISTITRQRNTDSEALKPVTNVLMNSFARELYSASRNPMDMLAFKVQNASKFVRKDNQTFFLKVADKSSVTAQFCLCLMNRCLILATKANPEDWNSLYYLSKVKAKLSHPPADVLDSLIRAIGAAKEQSVSGDPILEPSYKFLSQLYKYVKSNGVSIADGVRFLERDSTSRSSIEIEAKTKKEFYQLIIACLKKLVTLDKKAWYHKPAYRSALIQFTELGDLPGAKELLSKYFTLKSNNKTFLSMWKPENERPGKHFVYMFQYTMFYIKLLAKEKDLTSLSLMYPKLRRGNSTMISLNVAWEQLCTQICEISKKVLGIDAFEVTLFLSSTPSLTFVARINKVIEVFQPDKATSEMQRLLSFLHMITEVRKSNNGFGPTAMIDFTFTGIFLQIYRAVLTMEPSIAELTVPDSPNGKTKKLSKKDLFPYTIELANKCKRSTEQFLKFNPDIFNFYVTEHEREAELLRQRQAVEEERRRLAVLASQARFKRLVAQQTHYIEHKKSMFKMLAATIPRGKVVPEIQPVFTNGSPAALGHTHLNGPNFAANINQARPGARAMEQVYQPHGQAHYGPVNLYSTPHNYSLPGGNFNVGARPGHTSFIDPANYLMARQNVLAVIQPQFSQLSNNGSYQSYQGQTYRNPTTNETWQYNAGMTGPAPVQSMPQVGEAVNNSVQGTVDDPVEVVSDENSTEIKEPKRAADTANDQEERPSKKAREE